MKKLVSSLLVLVMMCSMIILPAHASDYLQESFFFESDPDGIGNFTYSKQNINPDAETKHIEWKGSGDRDWMLVADTSTFGYTKIDNVIQSNKRGEDSYVTYIDENFAGKSMSFVAIYDNMIINEMADGDWAGWRLLYKNMPYKLYAGPSEKALSEVEPTHFKTGAWEKAVFVEYMIKELPADAKVIKVVIPKWDHEKYADRKIGRITVSDDMDFVSAYVNPYREIIADEALEVRLQKMFADGKLINSLQEGNISATAVVASERSAKINASLLTGLYKKGVLVDTKSAAKLMNSYETAIISTESNPLNITLGDGESINDYEVKMWVLTDVGSISTLAGIEDTVDKDININPSDYQKYKLTVVSPKYTYEILGDTKIQMVAPGLSEVEAKCWKQNDANGEDSVVANVKLDANGVGSFVFPADEYPHGPLTIRLVAREGGRSDFNMLQLYNIGGVSFKEGLDTGTLPDVAKDLDLLFEDDFDGPLSIARFDTSATYGTHKIGFGDYSGVFFKDFEDENLNPFGQVDTYLRIRADQNKNSAGLLSTMHQDRKTGYQSLPPVYFECKMMAPYAKGTWPAIWTMTNNPAGPNDELDLLEAYGFDDDTVQWAWNGYSTIYHEWGREPTNPNFKFAGGPNMRKLGLSSWFESFHTYGLYVGEKETKYFVDGIEYASHPTWPSSLEYPTYLMFNLAIGGSSGWPFDLSKYNGTVDMYVDYIRIYNKQ